MGVDAARRARAAGTVINYSKNYSKIMTAIQVTPIRIQRKRTKGWRMPPNTVYVGRPSKWGNPFNSGNRVQDVDFFRSYRPYNLSMRTIR